MSVFRTSVFHDFVTSYAVSSFRLASYSRFPFYFYSELIAIEPITFAIAKNFTSFALVLFFSISLLFRILSFMLH